MSTPLFERLEALHDAGQITEDELDMIKLSVIELARDDVDTETDAVGSDGRDYVLHARDACQASGVDLDDESGEDDE